MATWMNLNECAHHLSVTPKAIYQKVHRHEIPHYKMNKRLLFKKEEIDEWVEAQRVPTDEEIRQFANHF